MDAFVDMWSNTYLVNSDLMYLTVTRKKFTEIENNLDKYEQQIKEKFKTELNSVKEKSITDFQLMESQAFKKVEKKLEEEEVNESIVKELQGYLSKVSAFFFSDEDGNTRPEGKLCHVVVKQLKFRQMLIRKKLQDQFRQKNQLPTGEIDKIENEISSYEAKISEYKEQRSELIQNIAAKRAEIATRKKELERKRKRIEKQNAELLESQGTLKVF